MTEQPPCKPSCRRVQRRQWRRDLVLFGALLVILFGVGYATLAILIGRVEAERTERVEASAALVEQVCHRDNDQDRALAALVRVSIHASEDPRIDRVFGEVLGRLDERRRRCHELAYAYIDGIE